MELWLVSWLDCFSRRCGTSFVSVELGRDGGTKSRGVPIDWSHPVTESVETLALLFGAPIVALVMGYCCWMGLFRGLR